MLRFLTIKEGRVCQRKTGISLVFFLVLLIPNSSWVLSAQSSIFPATYQAAVLQYRGGGDWYANPTALPNLMAFCNSEIDTDLHPETPYVEVGSAALHDYPFVHMTGHGNVVFSLSEAENLRAYLQGGGFLHISDNYGMDLFLRREMEKVFPELNWVEVPFDHPVYSTPYAFPTGLPKIHEHDNRPPRGYGLVFKGRLVCFYDVECDLGDGWEDAQVHRDPENVRRRALEMGANLVNFALSGGVFNSVDFAE